MMSQDGMVDLKVDQVPEITCSGCGSVLDVSKTEPFAQFTCPVCNAELTVPAKLGPFRLLSLIGTGGMGAVYHGVDDALGRDVAIKVMLKSLGASDEAVAIFNREARMAASLNHPNIGQIYSFGEEKGQPYIVMELVAGGSLDDLIGKGDPLHQGLGVQIGLDIAQGLSAAYDVELIHGDIKPKNILFDTKRTAKIVDFGLATFIDRAAAEQGIWGTPYYIAPEKILKRPIDGRSDIYSLGATLYHALAAQPPFDGETPVAVVKARFDRQPVPLTDLRDDILPSVNGVVMRMIEEQPSQRHPTYASLLGDLRNAMEEIKKKTSGPIVIPVGKIVFTRKSRTGASPTGRKDSPVPAAERSAPGSHPKAKVVLSRPARKAPPLSDEEIQARAEAKRRARRALKVFAVTFLAIVLLSAAGAGGYILYKQRAEEQSVQSEVLDILRQIDAEYAELSQPAEKAIKRADDYFAQSQKTAKKYETKANAVPFTKEGLKLARDATEKAAQLRQLLDKAKQIRMTAGQSKDPEAAQSQLDAIKSLPKDSADLQREITDLLKNAGNEMGKAFDEWSKDQ